MISFDSYTIPYDLQYKKLPSQNKSRSGSFTVASLRSRDTAATPASSGSWFGLLQRGSTDQKIYCEPREPPTEQRLKSRGFIKSEFLIIPIIKKQLISNG